MAREAKVLDAHRKDHVGTRERRDLEVGHAAQPREDVPYHGAHASQPRAVPELAGVDDDAGQARHGVTVLGGARTAD
jgi:hypothetical protein